MLQLPRSVRILLAAERIDMRNSIDGLAAVVKSSFKENVFAGHLFVFVGKRADKVKILCRGQRRNRPLWQTPRA